MVYYYTLSSCSMFNDFMLSFEIGHGGNVYILEIGKYGKLELGLLLCAFSALKEVMEKMLIMWIEFKRCYSYSC